MLFRLRQILEMIRFSHTVFALPFALSAAVMAWRMDARDDVLTVGKVVRELGGVLICMVGARSAAMAFNRLADRKMDADNPRTARRHLPAGQLSVGAVWVFVALSAVVFVAGTLLFLPNVLPLACSAPVLAFLLGYSYAKRFTSLAHFWLGAALMLAPICAWIAIRGQTVLQSPADLAPALWLGLAVMLWVAGFDIIYACQDHQFDLKAKLHSIPVKLGVAGALRLAAACHAGMMIALALLPWTCPQLGLGWIYVGSVACVGLLLLYEHWIAKKCFGPDDLSRVNTAFFHVNAIVSLALFAAVSLDLVI